MKRVLTHPLFVGIASILVLSLLVVRHPHDVSSDQAAFLSISNRILAGETPYIDYNQMNFPVVQYLNVVPNIVADVVEINVLVAFNILMVFSVGLSNYVSASLTKKLLDKKEDWYVWIFPSVLLLISLNSFVYSFGQREHLVIIVMFPALLWRSLRWHSEPFKAPVRGILLGLLVAIASTLKPHYLPLAFIPEIYWILSKRNIRPLFTSEVYTFVGFGVGHVLYFVLQPELTRNFVEYLGFISQGYGAFGDASYSEMFFGTRSLLIYFAVFLIGLLVPTYRIGKLWLTTRPASLMGIFLIFTYVVQRRGFEYQMLPYQSLGIVVIFLLFLYSLRIIYKNRAPASASIENIAWTFYLFSLILLAFAINIESPYPDHYMYINRDKFEPGDTLLYIDTYLPSIHPVISELDLRDISTFILSTPLAFGYYNYPETNYYDPDHKPPEFVAQFLDAVTLDITEKQPKYIFMKNGQCFECADNFRVFDFLEARDVIPDLIEPNYEVMTTWEDYIIYKRRTGEG